MPYKVLTVCSTTPRATYTLYCYTCISRTLTRLPMLCYTRLTLAQGTLEMVLSCMLLYACAL